MTRFLVEHLHIDDYYDRRRKDSLLDTNSVCGCYDGEHFAPGVFVKDSWRDFVDKY